ncbi:MAG: NAD-dependent epimerase/dehydratase family protein [Saprospiraceae bacterium]|nr:NAD-dependent epimerase/dehydratase family protein [Saprospiraceae bacterium]MCB0682159.1 NAD-dependent epimerase/dehydratase family protein [Saprospiraceae bacterium]
MGRNRVLITGANGQIGSVLTGYLRQQLGADHVLATDIRPPERETGPFEKLDVLDREQLGSIAKKYGVSHIYHLAAILSAKGEQDPLGTWHINMDGLFNVLEVARELQIERVFFPSSIAVIGEGAELENTPQYAALIPATVYGISKVAGELWGNYYYRRYGIDIRSVRYPGIIGYQSLPGGGTTDYAVDIFHKAVQGEAFECFLSEDTRLPMMYMEDAMRATLELMEAPAEKIRIRSSYNIAGMSFSPGELAAEIQKHLSGFRISYKPDYRQQIADSWSDSIDDEAARLDWGWKPKYDLASMTQDMLVQLRRQYGLPVH